VVLPPQFYGHFRFAHGFLVEAGLPVSNGKVSVGSGMLRGFFGRVLINGEAVLPGFIPLKGQERQP